MSDSLKQWYVLYTKTGCEKKVSNSLTRKNIVNYYPVTRQWSNRKKMVLEPLFRSYVFIHVAENELSTIRMTEGIINFGYWLGKPAIIRDEEIEVMKRVMDEYTNVSLEKIPFNVNGTVRVIGAPYSEQKSPNVSGGNNIVKVVLPSLGYMIVAELEKVDVEVLNSEKKPFNILEKFQYAVGELGHSI